MINTTTNGGIKPYNYYLSTPVRKSPKGRELMPVVQDMQEAQMLGKQVYDTSPPEPGTAFTPEGRELLELVEQHRNIGKIALAEQNGSK
jgi:DNA-binding HxlR family transcriptional regulator